MKIAIVVQSNTAIPVSWQKQFNPPCRMKCLFIPERLRLKRCRLT